MILHFLNLCIANFTMYIRQLMSDVQPCRADWNLSSQVMFLFLFLCSDKNTHVDIDN